MPCYFYVLMFYIKAVDIYIYINNSVELKTNMFIVSTNKDKEMFIKILSNDSTQGSKLK